MFGNFFLFKTPFPGRSSIPPSFVSFFVFYIFSYLLSKTMGCFSGCLMSSAGFQKLFCGIYLAFKCSFDEFVGEKVVSPSYSSAILAPPYSSNLSLFLNVLTYLFSFLAVLCLCCCTGAFSSCCKLKLLQLLSCSTAVSLVEHRLGCRPVSSWGSQAQLPGGTWNLHGSGIEPISPALADGFLTTGPRGKSTNLFSFTGGFNPFTVHVIIGKKIFTSAILLLVFCLIVFLFFSSLLPCSVIFF